MWKHSLYLKRLRSHSALLNFIFNHNLVEFLSQSVYYSHFLDIMCWAYVRLQVVYLLLCRTRTEMYSKINKVECLIYRADILWAVVRLAGSLIKQLFCVFFFLSLMFSLNSSLFFFLNKRSVSLLVCLLSTCQSFVSCTFLKAHVGTRAHRLFEDCVCGLDCSDISCWFNVTLHLETLSSGGFLFLPPPLSF